MSLSILNNVAALYAQNNINTTQSSLQKTLQQLSSGSRINSGADDPSGLAVSDGLNANQSALTQSATNATEGIGLLQTADGALSQVTSLLNQAITIATEIGGGTLTGSQIGSANQAYTNILSQIGDIGAKTNYNSNSVFTNNAVNVNVTDGTSNGTSSYSEIVGGLSTTTIGTGPASGTAQNVGGTDSSEAGLAMTLKVSAASSTVGGTLTINGGSSTYNLTVAAGTTMSQLAGDLSNDTKFAAAGLSITGMNSTTISIGPTNNSNTLSNGSPSSFQETPIGTGTGRGVDLQTSMSTISAVATDPNSAKAVAQAITTAIQDVAYQRGTLGADINQLSSAASVASAEQVNLSSAQNAVTATDYGQAASNLSKYQILSQTGISALAQANSVQQEVLKLLQ